MIIQNLKITDFASIDDFSYRFNEGLSIIRNRMTEEISLALCLLLNHSEAPPIPSYAIRGATKIEATIIIDGEELLLVALPDKFKRKLILKAYKGEQDVTSEYLFLTRHCAEHDTCDIFDGAQASHNEYPLRLLEYSDYEQDTKRCDLAKRTYGFSRLQVFNSYLRKFIKSFSPQPICNGKRYALILDENGLYKVRYMCDNDSPIYLSEAESILFRYLCFLKTAEFWHGFEEIRNMQAIKKPLIMKNFIERLDESINAQEIIDKSMSLNRQAILLTAH